MHPFLSLLLIAGTLALGAMSPGPTFVVVAKNAISLSRRHGFATALGSGLGACLFALIALSGLHAVFRAVPLLFWIFKVAGGLYLIYLASKILRHARQPIMSGEGLKNGTTLRQAFRFGLTTQLSNPKTAVFFAGLFSALLPSQMPGYFFLVLPLIAWMIDSSWYAAVAFLLSSEKPRNTYLRCKTIIDRSCGGVLALLGVKLVLSQ
jgi:threonine/homoserine/homoserine lactone efflux protein